MKGREREREGGREGERERKKHLPRTACAYMAGDFFLFTASKMHIFLYPTYQRIRAIRLCLIVH